MRAVFLDLDTVSDGDLDLGSLRRALPGIVMHPNSTASQMSARIQDCEVVLGNKVKVTRAIMEAHPSLRLIAVTATGVDNIDLVAARERGIAVCNLRDYCTASVAQHVFAMILALTQRLREYDALARSGGWSSASQFSVFSHPIRELQGRVLGIMGYGALGRAVAQLGSALGMRVLIANRPETEMAEGRVALGSLLLQADVLTLHCPLTPATVGLLGAAELARMKPDALLINTARGALVDATALAKALREGRLGGAGIDVLDREPPVEGNPLLDPEIPNLYVTPHVAWAAREARQRCLDELALNVLAFQQGERRNRVD